MFQTCCCCLSYCIVTLIHFVSVPDALTDIEYVPLSSSQLRVNFATPPLSVTKGVVESYTIIVREYKGAIIETKSVPAAENSSDVTAIFNGLSESHLYVKLL